MGRRHGCAGGKEPLIYCALRCVLHGAGAHHGVKDEAGRSNRGDRTYRRWSGNTKSPPGAATLITDRPKLEYEASRSKTAGGLKPNAPKPTGPVAATAIPLPDCPRTSETRPSRWGPLCPPAPRQRLPRAPPCVSAR